jgi:hypothetical protein
MLPIFFSKDVKKSISFKSFNHRIPTVLKNFTDPPPTQRKLELKPSVTGAKAFVYVRKFWEGGMLKLNYKKNLKFPSYFLTKIEKYVAI